MTKLDYYSQITEHFISRIEQNRSILLIPTSTYVSHEVILRVVLTFMSMILGVAFKTQFPSPVELNVNECLKMATKFENSQHAVGYLFL
jgi:hypothetical protein